MLLCGWQLLIISHNPVKFGDHKPCGGRSDITFFICHVTLCDYVINKLYDYVDKSHSSEVIILSRLVATWFAEVEIKRFLFAQWSPDHMMKAPQDSASGSILLSTHNLSSLVAIGRVKVEIYRFSFVSWFHVTTLSKGHVTLSVVASYP